MTTRLRSGQLGGTPYTDAMASAAMVSFRDYDFDFFATPLVVATPTLTSYRLVTTKALSAWKWQVTLVIYLTGSNAGTVIGADIEIDGNPLGVVLSSAVVPGGGYLQSATVPQVWAAGVHSIEYFASQPSGPGQVTVIESVTTLVRES